MNIFLKYTISGIQKTFDYKGRAVRSEYWWFILFAFIYYFIFIFIFGGEAIENGAIFLLHNLIWLPAISLLVRRLHDVGRSGWWVLISLTGFGALLLLYWAVKESSPDKNQWGNFLESFKEDNKPQKETKFQASEKHEDVKVPEKKKIVDKKPEEPKKESQMSNTEKLYNEFPHISEEPKEFNFGSMVGYAMMMLSVSFDDDGDQDELQVIFEKLQTMWGVPVRMSGDQANEIWTELQLWYNALTDLPDYGNDEKYKIVEWMIESVKNPAGQLEEDIDDMILQVTGDILKVGDEDWAPSYMLQALTDVANANNKVTGDEKSFLIWCAEHLGYDIDFSNLTFSKSSEDSESIGKQGMLTFSSYSAHPPSKNGEFNAHNSNYFQICKYDDNGISSLGFVDSYGGIGKGKNLSIPILLDGNSIILKSIENWDEGSDDQYFIQMEDCSSIAKKYKSKLCLSIPETQKEEPSVVDSSEETPTEPVESSGDPVEDFRSFLASKYPTLKLPKGKKYVEFPIGKGMLVCCMVKTNGVNVYLYSGGKVPAREVFDKLNSLGVSGKVLNDKYTITPMPGSRNPNVVRIDLLVPYDNRDLDNDDLREEVLDLYTQLIDLCMPLNPDNPFYDSPTKSVESQSEKIEPVQEDSVQSDQETKSGTLKIVIEGKMHKLKIGILQDELREGLDEVIKYLDDYDTIENLINALWYGRPSEIFEPIPKESWDQITSDYPVIEQIQGTSMGGVWEEFWIFYEPWVIDNDNQISIYLNDEILVSGEVGSLFEKTCDPGYKRDDVKEILGIDLTPQEVMGKINCKVSYPFLWDEEIAELIGDKEEFGSDHEWDLSKYGWQISYIDHSVFKQKIKEVEYGTNRMQVTEYGKYKIVSDEIDLENFDWQRLVFLRNSTIWDFVPNQKEYALSHVLYAFEDGGLEELFFTIHDFSILDVTYNDSWPTDE